MPGVIPHAACKLLPVRNNPECVHVHMHVCVSSRVRAFYTSNSYEASFLPCLALVWGGEGGNTQYTKHLSLCVCVFRGAYYTVPANMVSCCGGGPSDDPFEQSLLADHERYISVFLVSHYICIFLVS